MSVQRETASVQRSRHLHKQEKCNVINRMNGVNKLTVSVRRNDTSVFLVGGHLKSDYKVTDL